MNVLFNLIVVLQVLSALTIIGLVLVQHGKGADMGAAFGSGASGSLFGASGSSNFLSKSTAIAAAIFFSATLALAYFGTSRPAANVGVGVMERASTTAPANNAGNAVPNTVPAPAAPAAPAATQDVPTAPAAQAPAAPAPVPAPAK